MGDRRELGNRAPSTPTRRFFYLSPLQAVRYLQNHPVLSNFVAGKHSKLMVNVRRMVPRDKRRLWGGKRSFAQAA
jgi:hypothetical protein